MVSSIVMAVTVLLSLKYLRGWLCFTPTAVLASMILSAVPGLIDFNKARHIWKVDKIDFLACAAAFFGVLFLSVEMGLMAAVISTLSPFNFFCFWSEYMIQSQIYTKWGKGRPSKPTNTHEQILCLGVNDGPSALHG